MMTYRLIERRRVSFAHPGRILFALGSLGGGLAGLEYFGPGAAGVARHDWWDRLWLLVGMAALGGLVGALLRLPFRSRTLRRRMPWLALGLLGLALVRFIANMDAAPISVGLALCWLGVLGRGGRCYRAETDIDRDFVALALAAVAAAYLAAPGVMGLVGVFATN